MQRKIIYIFLLLVALDVKGQRDENVTVMSVEDAIAVMESEYRVRFSYSKQIVPYQEIVALNMSEGSLPTLLASLTTQTGIKYQQKGRRVVLNFDGENESIVDQLSATRNKKPIGKIESDSKNAMATQENEAIVSSQPQSFEVNENEFNAPKEAIFVSRRKEIDPVAVFAKLEEKDPRVLSLKEGRKSDRLASMVKERDKVHFAQVSLVPFPKFAAQKLSRKYHLSFNTIAGVSGAVEGFELGGIYNGIKKDFDGVQMSGFGNYVEGNIRGGQIAGGFNYNRGITRGVQIGGVANINHQADAVQVGGLFNYNKEVSRGLQLAGAFNISRNIAGSQLAGLFNYSTGDLDVQVSGFTNIADETDIQIAGFVNVARKVDYVQIGLINIADTVGGASFGLLNLIRKGYNKVEFSVGDAMYGNIAVKLGTRKFYNIFQVSSNFRKNITNNGLIWGYGYGFGFFQRISNYVKFNPELLVMNIHEKNLIQPDLNLLNQFKLLFHFNRASNIELFAGPSMNWSIAKIKSYDSAIIGTQIAPYDLWSATYFLSNNIISTKFWIGFSAGVRI